MKQSLFCSLTLGALLFSMMINSMDAPISTIDYRDITRINPVHRTQLLDIFNAAHEKKWDTCKQLILSYNGPLQVTNAEGYTLVHTAVLGNQEECLADLIAKGACVTYYNLARKPIIATPLHWAAHKGYTNIAKMLLEVDKTIINSTHCMYGNTPLHLAAWSNHLHVTRFLLNEGAHINQINRLGSTPIHSAAWKNSAKSLQILLEYGGSATQINHTGKGNTPLYLAAKAGSSDCLILLINHLKKHFFLCDLMRHLNEPCSGDNSTAIQSAAVRQNIQCYWHLLMAGADYHPKFHLGKNPSISEIIFANKPLQKFVENIEKNGKTDCSYNGPDAACRTCTKSYKNNDVIVELSSCNHSFHTDCFQNHAADHFITKHENSNFVQALIKDQSPREMRHSILTNPIEPIYWELVDRCPHCFHATSFNNCGKIAVVVKD